MKRFGSLSEMLHDDDPFGPEAPCRRINQDCIVDGVCTARTVARPCWSVPDVACCPRNDKSRCCYCSVYLAYLDFKESGRVHRVPMQSSEDPGFASLGRRSAEHPGQKGGDVRYLPPHKDGQ